jgi:predicted dehydrogenase
MSSKKGSRRNFIRNAGIAAAGFYIIPRHVMGRGFIAPSDKLNIGSIGVGGKGEGDIREFLKSPHVNMVALCDVDDRQSIKSRGLCPKATYYKDFREMLKKEKNNIDAVSVSTPDNVHAVAALAAMQLGKHVYVQKPMAHDIYEARILTQAAQKYKVVTQMGNQGGSGDGVRRAKEIYDAGLIGRVHTVHAWTNRPVWPQGIPNPSGQFPIPPELDWDLWQGPAKSIEYNPAYLPFNWRGWWAYGTGALGDMACHIMDPFFRILPVKYPNTVEASVSMIWKEMWNDTQNYDACPPSTIVHFNFPCTDNKGDIKLSWYDGGLLPPLPEELTNEDKFGNWDGGILFIGKKGKLMMDCYGENPRLLPTKFMKEKKLPPQTLPRVTEGHYLQWVNACMAGFEKTALSSSFDYAGPFAESILLGNLAIRSFVARNPNGKGWDDKYLGRKKLMWDAANMKITNFDDANGFVKRTYRDGWTLDL